MHLVLTLIQDVDMSVFGTHTKYGLDDEPRNASRHWKSGLAWSSGRNPSVRVGRAFYIVLLGLAGEDNCLERVVLLQSILLGCGTTGNATESTVHHNKN